MKTRFYNVYLIKFGNLPYYKIGIAKNVLARIVDLEIGSPFDLELICSAKIEDAYVIEQALHRKFWNLRKKGEWFQLAKTDVDFIKNALETLDNKTETEKKYNL